jgi:hypothetical protein
MSDPVNVKILRDDNIMPQLIGLGFAVASAVVIVLVQRKVSDPDFILTCKMRILNGTARYADSRAQFWANISRFATNAYIESRV